MRIVICLAAATAAGCASVSTLQEAWHWDATQQQARAAFQVQDVATVDSRVTALRQQHHQIRSLISAEPDIWARQKFYAELHEVGLRLSLLERQRSGAPPAR